MRTRPKNTPARCERIVASATSSVAQKEVFIAPVSAIEQVLAKAQLRMANIDLIELNEAFAAQLLACQRPLAIDPAKLNVNGGTIAQGHPIGASGARVLVTLLHELARRNLRRGLAAFCLGGGNAVAMIIERNNNLLAALCLLPSAYCSLSYWATIRRHTHRDSVPSVPAHDARPGVETLLNQFADHRNELGVRPHRARAGQIHP